jgi:hypothetical protein
MKILGVGLSKTGTTSLHRALGMLGYHSLHYDQHRLNDIIDGTNRFPDFRRYDDVDAVLDIPTACFFEELTQAYPDCKCILTLREEDQWWRSIEEHFNRKSPVPSPQHDLFKWRVRHYVYGAATAHEFLFRKKYRQHNDNVLRTVPAHRLLVMDITAGDGWERLCPFLGISAPPLAFPHDNRQGVQDRVDCQRIMSEVEELVPEAATFVLVDENTIGVSQVTNRRALPFLERDGQYDGVPSDDESAIHEIERMRRSGASHIVFAWPAFWWLEHYLRFRKHLENNYRCVRRNDRLVAFDLRLSKV